MYSVRVGNIEKSCSVRRYGTAARFNDDCRMTFTARLLPQTPPFSVPTWPQQNLVQTGYVSAQFLLVGEIIERKSLMFRTLTLPVWSHAEIGRVVIVVENELGGMETISVTAGVEIPIFEVEE